MDFIDRRNKRPIAAAEAALRQAERSARMGRLGEAEHWCACASRDLARARAAADAPISLEEEDALQAELEARLRAFIEAEEKDDES
jgi:hypothetical protein